VLNSAVRAYVASFTSFVRCLVRTFYYTSPPVKNLVYSNSPQFFSRSLPTSGPQFCWQ